MARGIDGESGNALILCQEENNIVPCAGAYQGSLGWGSDCKKHSFFAYGGWWTVLLPPVLFLDWTVSTVLLLYHC